MFNFLFEIHSYKSTDHPDKRIRMRSRNQRNCTHTVLISELPLIWATGHNISDGLVFIPRKGSKLVSLWKNEPFLHARLETIGSKSQN